MKKFKIRSSHDGIFVIRLQHEEKPIGFVKKIWAANRPAHNIGREKRRKSLGCSRTLGKATPVQV